MDRASSFGAVADDYDRLRPTPPPEAVDWIVPGRVSLAIDVGAGTGAMTRQLVERAERVVAVEPDPRMRAVLARRTPGVEAVAGQGEAMPLPDAVADLVVVASAWHWMDPSRAVPEVARVLRDGGRFAVVWNGRNTRVDWMAETIDAVLPRSDAERDEAARRLRALTIPPGEPFGDVESAQFDFTRRLTVAEVAESFGTYSRIITMGPEAAAAAIGRAQDVLAARFGGPDAVLDVPFRARAFRCERLPR